MDIYLRQRELTFIQAFFTDETPPSAVAGRCRRRPHTTDSRHGYAVAPNLLERHFDVGAPNVAWCGDITYIWTEEGRLYTAVLLDLYSRKVVGWAMSDHVDTQF
jgi:transposase InsO family protein